MLALDLNAVLLHKQILLFLAYVIALGGFALQVVDALLAAPVLVKFVVEFAKVSFGLRVGVRFIEFFYVHLFDRANLLLDLFRLHVAELALVGELFLHLLVLLRLEGSALLQDLEHTQTLTRHP